MGGDTVRDVISNINNLIVDLRPETDAETENPNQKSDLEIFDWNGINTPDKQPIPFSPPCKNITIYGENSKWDEEFIKELKKKQCIIDDPFFITDDEDWIKEALNGDIKI